MPTPQRKPNIAAYTPAMADKRIVGGYVWNGQVADGLSAIKHARDQLRLLHRALGRDPESRIAATLFELGSVQDILFALQQIGDEAKR